MSASLLQHPESNSAQIKISGEIIFDKKGKLISIGKTDKFSILLPIVKKWILEEKNADLKFLKKVEWIIKNSLAH